MKLEHMKDGRWHAYVFGPLGHWHLVATGATKAEAEANAAKAQKGKGGEMNENKKRKVCLELRFATDDDFGLRIEPQDMADEKKLGKLPYFPFFKTRNARMKKGDKSWDGYFRDDKEVTFLRNVAVDLAGNVYADGVRIPARVENKYRWFQYYLRIVDTLDRAGLTRLLYVAYDLAVNRVSTGTHTYNGGDWFELWRPIIDALNENLSRITEKDDGADLNGPMSGAEARMYGNYSGTRLGLREVTNDTLPRIVRPRRTGLAGTLKKPEGKKEAK